MCCRVVCLGQCKSISSQIDLIWEHCSSLPHVPFHQTQNCGGENQDLDGHLKHCIQFEFMRIHSDIYVHEPHLRIFFLHLCIICGSHAYAEYAQIRTNPYELKPQSHL